MRALIVGAGAMGKAWGRNLRDCPDVEVAGWVDIAPDRAATAADDCGIAGIHTLSHIGTSGAVWLLGVIKEATGSFPMALIPLALLQISGIVAVLWINKQETLPATFRRKPVH